MPMTPEEVQELIDFENNVVRDMDKAIKLMGGGPLVEMAAGMGKEKHQGVIKALKEFKDLLTLKQSIDG